MKAIDLVIGGVVLLDAIGYNIPEDHKWLVTLAYTALILQCAVELLKIIRDRYWRKP